ncbi:hypothetical protein ACXYRQ_04060 [Mycoplasma sp. 394]
MKQRKLLFHLAIASFVLSLVCMALWAFTSYFTLSWNFVPYKGSIEFNFSSLLISSNFYAIIIFSLPEILASLIYISITIMIIIMLVISMKLFKNQIISKSILRLCISIFSLIILAFPFAWVPVISTFSLAIHVVITVLLVVIFVKVKIESNRNVIY